MEKMENAPLQQKMNACSDAVMERPAIEFDWEEYINRSVGKPPRQPLVRTVEVVKGKDKALDLGAGALNETRFLAESGFPEVVAVDMNKRDDLVDALDKNVVTFVQMGLEEYQFPVGDCDIVSAQFVLPFIKKEKLNYVMKGIANALKEEGLFTGQFFGPRDDWNGVANVQIFMKEEVEKIFRDVAMEIIDMQEEEWDEKRPKSKKHFHAFNVIAKKTH